MARPEKKTVEYFPHYVNHKKTMFIIESLWGNDGYAFWFKLLELLGATPGHVYDCNKADDWEFLLAKTRLSGDTVTEILNKLAKLDAIDPDLWAERIIWSQNFVDGLAPVYRKRKQETPSRPSFRRRKPEQEDISDAETPQSKVKKSREENNSPPIIPPKGGSDERAAATEDNNAISGESLLVETATGEPNEVSHSKTQKRTKKTLSLVQKARFDRFWTVWPHKVSKGQAEITWGKLDPDDDLTGKIIEGVRRAIKYDRRFQPGGFMPHASTWLNAKGWEDEHQEQGPSVQRIPRAFASIQQYVDEEGQHDPF